MSWMHRATDDDLQRLLAEGPFLGALARELAVGDADDVVQQTWLRVLQQDRGGIERPRGWLARVAGNVARNMRRDERRRRQREQAAAVRELVPSSAELMLREERRRELLAAVDALPPTLRAVVLLRWFDGWPPRRIARELGMPAATVSTQLQRALHLLRQRLDAAHRGYRRAWLLPLLPAGGPRWPVPQMTPAMLTGGIAMMTKTKLALAATALVVAAVWLFSFAGATPQVQPASFEAADPSVLSLPAATAAPGASSQLPVRSEVSVRPETATTGSLVVRVRSAADGAPARDLPLILQHPGRDPRFEAWRQRTDGEGMARFDALPPGSLYLATNGDPGLRVTIAAGVTEEVDYALAAGLMLRGVVVDDAGAPVPGAVVEVAPLAHAHAVPERVATTGEDGSFTAAHCPRSSLVGARAAGFAASDVRFLIGRDGSTGEVRLVLGREGGCVEGVVVDGDGGPVADAVVIVGDGEFSGIVGREHNPPFAALVRSGADGRFLAVGVRPGAQPVRARAIGLAPWQGSVGVTAWQTALLRIEMVPGATVRGVVRDDGGTPVAGAEVEVGRWSDVAHYRVRTSADGAYELTGLPIGDILVRAEHDDDGRCEKPVRTVAGSATGCDLQLSLGLVLAGRVVGADGGPLPEVVVECYGETGRWTMSTRSDADGRFVVADCPQSGTVRIVARGTGIEELRISGIDPRAGELVLRPQPAAPRTVRITGIVVGPDGAAVANASAMALRHGTYGGSGIEPTDDRGRFELGPVAAGAWRVQVHAADHPLFRSEVRHLADGAVWDLGTIRLPRGGTATVRLRGDVSGAKLSVMDRALTGGWAVGEVHGQLRTGVLAPGDYLLMVRGEGIAADAVPFAVGPGLDTVVDVHPQPGTAQHLEVVVPAGTTGSAGVALVVRRAGRVVTRAGARLGPGQAAAAEVWLAAGDYAVVAEAGTLRGSAAFTVGDQPGAPVRVTLR